MQPAEWDFFKQKDFFNDSTTLHKLYNSVTNIYKITINFT